jgi:hypothetical protein
MAAPVNEGVTKPFQMPDEFKLPQTEQWSVPPVLTGDPGGPMTDMAIRLRQGIVCEVRMNDEWLFQNVNDNNDDIIHFSLHGNPEGIWGELNPRSFVRAKCDIYFINRTHKDVLYLASFKQNTQ